MDILEGIVKYEWLRIYTVKIKQKIVIKVKLIDPQCQKCNFVKNNIQIARVKMSTSSSCSPISSSAAECLRLRASSSARNPGKTPASARSFSHCL